MLSHVTKLYPTLDLIVGKSQLHSSNGVIFQKIKSNNKTNITIRGAAIKNAPLILTNVFDMLNTEIIVQTTKSTTNNKITKTL